MFPELFLAYLRFVFFLTFQLWEFQAYENKDSVHSFSSVTHTPCIILSNPRHHFKWLTFKANFCFYHLAWFEAALILINFEKICTEENDGKVYLILKKINVNIM